MMHLNQYKIAIFGLSNKLHTFEFGYDDELFAVFEQSLISRGKGTCIIELTKTDSMITLDFKINGTIELECDKSLELFDHPINVEREVIYKFGNEEKELSEDVWVIPKGTNELEVASLLYEFIHLEIPMRKIHPNLQNETETDEVIYSSQIDPIESNENVDPRWEALKKLK